MSWWIIDSKEENVGMVDSILEDICSEARKKFNVKNKEDLTVTCTECEVSSYPSHQDIKIKLRFYWKDLYGRDMKKLRYEIFERIKVFVIQQLELNLKELGFRVCFKGD